MFSALDAPNYKYYSILGYFHISQALDHSVLKRYKADPTVDV